MYQSGLQILAAPTWDKSSNWQMSMQHIAREGGVFVISVCQSFSMDDLPDRYDFKSLYPEGREWINQGNSCIIGPNGKILAGPLEAKEGILYAVIDLNDIIAAKRMFDATGHYARPDCFEFKILASNRENVSFGSGYKVRHPVGDGRSRGTAKRIKEIAGKYNIDFQVLDKAIDEILSGQPDES